MAEGKEESAAQLSGLQSKLSSKYLSPQCVMQTSVQAGDWCGERGCSQISGQK